MGSTRTFRSTINGKQAINLSDGSTLRVSRKGTVTLSDEDIEHHRRNLSSSKDPFRNGRLIEITSRPTVTDPVLMLPDPVIGSDPAEVAAASAEVGRPAPDPAPDPPPATGLDPADLPSPISDGAGAARAEGEGTDSTPTDNQGKDGDDTKADGDPPASIDPTDTLTEADVNAILDAHPATLKKRLKEIKAEPLLHHLLDEAKRRDLSDAKVGAIQAQIQANEEAASAHREAKARLEAPQAPVGPGGPLQQVR